MPRSFLVKKLRCYSHNSDYDTGSRETPDVLPSPEATGLDLRIASRKEAKETSPKEYVPLRIPQLAHISNQWGSPSDSKEDQKHWDQSSSDQHHHDRSYSPIRSCSPIRSYSPISSYSARSSSPHSDIVKSSSPHLYSASLTDYYKRQVSSPDYQFTSQYRQPLYEHSSYSQSPYKASVLSESQSVYSHSSSKSFRGKTDSPDLYKSSSPHSDAGRPNSDSEGQEFQNGVTVGYTYDAFFITDGRSKRKTDVSKVSKQRYVCSECGKDYATSSNLSRHKQTHRSLDSQLAKQCPHCDKRYVSMPALSMHILTHELKHVCPVCDKKFSRPWLLQGHLRSHSGEKPFGCAHCGKAFADRSNLRAHMQTHSKYKSHECHKCHKSFALKSYLNKHLESACVKDGESSDEGIELNMSPEPIQTMDY